MQSMRESEREAGEVKGADKLDKGRLFLWTLKEDGSKVGDVEKISTRNISDKYLIY